MDFQESEAFLKENETKQHRKKMLLIGIVVCILFVAFMATIIVYLQIQDQHTFKVYLNNKKVVVSKNFVKVEEGKKPEDTKYYINLEEISNILGYLFQDGSISLTDGENLYSLTTYYEKIDLNVDSMTYDKYVTSEGTNVDQRKATEVATYGQELTIRTPNNTREIFHFVNPLKIIDGSVYVSKEDLMLLLSIDYNWENINRFYLYSLDNIFSMYAPVATKTGYTSLSSDFENIRAILDGYLIVEKNNKYGVITIDGNTIIEAKYDRILYSQNSKEFFVYANSRAGLIDQNGKQLIPPNSYQDISILDQNLDQENRLYLVSKDGKFGVVNRKNEELIHPLYDRIGLDENVELYKSLPDPIILYNTIIPVKQENAWGLYNLETGDLSGSDESTDQFNYAGFGCDISNNKTSANQKSVVLIPKDVGIKGVVIMYKSGVYGIYDCNVNRITVTFMWTKIYSNTDNKTGITSYYMEKVDGEKVELRQFLEENGLITETGEDEEDDDTETSGGGTSFTDEMNNLSTEGKLHDTSNEDEQYFDDLNNENNDDNNPTDENEEDDNNDEDTNEESPDEDDEETDEE